MGDWNGDAVGGRNPEGDVHMSVVSSAPSQALSKMERKIHLQRCFLWSSVLGGETEMEGNRQREVEEVRGDRRGKGGRETRTERRWGT